MVEGFDCESEVFDADLDNDRERDLVGSSGRELDAPVRLWVRLRACSSPDVKRPAVEVGPDAFDTFSFRNATVCVSFSRVVPRVPGRDQFSWEIQLSRCPVN